MHKPLAALVIVFAGCLATAVIASLLASEPASAGSQEADAKTPGAKPSGNKRSSASADVAKADAAAKVRLPRWWRPSDPLPAVKSNCVRCHLTAGRELTAPVEDFAHSVHDLHGLTCSDCHGGNREKDASAHDERFGFIGTKLSAHMANCGDCHSEQAEQVKSGPHYWDFSKKINLDYPVCIDCHGHHDVAKPPAEFALATVCSECHLLFDQELPAWASVVAENDRLWNVLRKVQHANVKSDKPVPERFHDQLAAARQLTAKLIHPAAKLGPREAEQLNAQTAKIRGELETWLAREAPASEKGKTR